MFSLQIADVTYWFLGAPGPAPPPPPSPPPPPPPWSVVEGVEGADGHGYLGQRFCDRNRRRERRTCLQREEQDEAAAEAEQSTAHRTAIHGDRRRPPKDGDDQLRLPGPDQSNRRCEAPRRLHLGVTASVAPTSLQAERNGIVDVVVVVVVDDDDATRWSDVTRKIRRWRSGGDVTVLCRRRRKNGAPVGQEIAILAPTPPTSGGRHLNCTPIGAQPSRGNYTWRAASSSLCKLNEVETIHYFRLSYPFINFQRTS